jgi:tetratricopeptide (TPR) repeat protein
MTDLIPIAYLAGISCVLILIIWFMFIQIINFQIKSIALSQLRKAREYDPLDIEDNYKLANLCMENYLWSQALNILDNGLNSEISISRRWNAKYCNAIGFIYEKTNYKLLAMKYYQEAINLDPNYKYAMNNLDQINN